MLIAVTSSEKRLSLLSPNDYPSLDNNPPPYFCPVCRQHVILKKGKIRRWHFAHRSKSFCPSLSEPETEEHLLGKLTLYHWLYEQGLSPSLEVYLPAIQRQADLLVSMSDTLYAIEFQCAVITEQEIIARTSDYLSIGIHPVWIFSLSRLHHTDHGNYRVNSFEWTGLRARKCDGRHALLYFSPTSASFSFLFPRIVISNSHVYGDYYSHPAKQLPLSEIIDLPATVDGPGFSGGQWLRLKMKWRFGRNDWRTQNDKTFMRHVFTKFRSDLPFFPAEAGWPHLSMEVIRTPPYLWQSWFLLQFLRSQSYHDVFHSESIEEAINELANRSVLHLRKFPLIHHPLSSAVRNYLFLLEKIGVVKKVEKGWKKKRDVSVHRSLDDGFEADKKWNKRIRY